MKKAICLLLSAAALLTASGCRGADGQRDGGADDISLSDGDGADSDIAQDSAVAEPLYASDDKFTLDYDPDKPFNPLLTESAENLLVSGLVYEGFFSVDNNFNAEKNLIADYSTEDGVNYTFTLIPDIYFHSGAPLTAQDAVYSLNRAKASARFRSRLEDVDTVKASDELTFTVKLKRANYSLPVLLDVPVIEYNTSQESCPPGTGPYIPMNAGIEGGGTYLIRNDSYRALPDSAPETVYLTEVSAAGLGESLSRSVVDLIEINPTGSGRAVAHKDCSMDQYDTSVLQYIGFNTDNLVLYDEKVRLALSYLIDRDMLCTEVLDSLSRPAPLVLSSALACYSPRWEETAPGCSLETFSEKFAEMGMIDHNGDGYLDYPVGNGYRIFSLTFVVNADNSYDLDIARYAVIWLKNVGIDITLQELSRAEYEKALETGAFDLYLASVRLSPDFDLTELLTFGGSLNYGDIRDSEYKPLIDAFLAAEGSEKAEAAEALCLHASEKAHIIPIAYKKHTVVTSRSSVKGLSPSQSSVFHGFSDWVFADGAGR